MIVVRFPDGLAVSYRTANFLRRTGDAWQIYEGDPDKGGIWVASIPSSTPCIVEAIRPSSVEKSFFHAGAMEHVIDHIRDYNGRQLRRLKRAVSGFNTKTYAWRAKE